MDMVLGVMRFRDRLRHDDCAYAHAECRELGLVQTGPRTPLPQRWGQFDVAGIRIHALRHELICALGCDLIRALRHLIGALSDW
jgi:hypothetical protein